MQTRLSSSMSRRHRIITTSIMVASALFCTACAAPNIEGRAQSEQRFSPCETAYYAASDLRDVLQSAIPRLSKYFAASQAASQWLDVASYCTGRFDEGVIRSAQSRQQANTIAAQFDMPTLQQSTRPLDNVDDLDLDDATLAAMALAEDRLGFIAEVAAARNIDDVTLADADSYHSTGERLIDLADDIDDPRLKVYDITDSGLLDGAETIIDPANGLNAPLMAVARMNCAREEMTAISNAAADGADAADDSDDSAQPTSSAKQNRADSLHVLAQLVSNHAYRAFQNGYPSFDEALLKK